MKKMKNWLLTGLFFMVVSTVFSQGKITGTITDGIVSLPGANVVIKGSTTSTSTDFDGKFTIDSPTAAGELYITYLGYNNLTVKFTVSKGATTNLGKIVLESDSNQLEEIVVMGKGIIDLAKDRKTPIAVSTIKAAEIQAKIGTADITQTMVNTPSVYVAGQSGGYGDSRISVRGFAQDNTAFLLNGQPINGMEDGKVYWSNWSGLSDIANAVQIQRGLGSSKLAISSVGGTVNFITKATEKNEGGFVSLGVANDNYFKTTAAYNTGMSKSGWGTSVMLSHWQGDGYNDGTKGEGQTYFISVGYKANDKHSFNFLLTGAPQWHDQNFTKSIDSYLKYGRKYNNNWGTQNGEYKSERTNYYHKPVANINWDYDISDKTQLSTVLYGSWGRGGGTGSYGTKPATAAGGQINFDGIFASNQAIINGKGNADGRSTNGAYVIRASVNNHAWYGLVSNLKNQLTDNLALNVGLDLRTYKGTHFRQVSDFMGLSSWTDTRNLKDGNSNPSGTMKSNYVTESGRALPWPATFNTIAEDQRIDYDYGETISYGGVFSQLEYSKDNFSAFFQGSLSNQSHSRVDRFDYLPQYQDSKKVDNVGYNVKGGTSYKIAEQHTIYANAGYYSRQPYHDNIYLNFTNAVNPLTKNEKIFGLEAGYTFASKIVTASVNAYRTSWKDRVTTTSTTATAADVAKYPSLQLGDLIYKTNEGVEQVHTGVELDFVAKPTHNLNLTGFLSVGDWQYKGNTVTTTRDESLSTLDKVQQDVDGGKVGDGAQVTYGLGFRYEFVKNLSIDADWRYYDKLYSNVGAVKNNLELPSYDLVDSGISYKLFIGKGKHDSIGFRVNVNNVFDEVYLSELTTATAVTPTSNNYKGINVANTGYFGLGRTWNFSLRYNF
ncbi:TonB-dependent receptor [Flavobacterium oncorhynchi]|uniref:TonB-dependent receptor n=2 Tax=Flavobacterium oncorhynchi TaxID=728056 RepID=A0A226I5P4_9FLAO|nr:TonB-dependent receptor [Flavobacterium oncorhynchi]